MRSCERDPLFRDVSSEDQEGGLRAAININRERAGQLGVSVQAVNDTLNDAFGQRQISTIYGQANQYRVVLEALPEFQRDPSVLAKLYVPGVGGAQVPIAAVAELERTTAPLAISNQSQFPAITLELQSGARCFARAGGRRGRARREADRHAGIDRRRLFRRRGRIRALAAAASRG